MKTKVTKPEARDFQPLKIELTVETVQEARWLFHVVNWNRLTRVLKEREDYMYIGYEKDFQSPVFFSADSKGDGEYLWEALKEHIKSQGFKL